MVKISKVRGQPTPVLKRRKAVLLSQFHPATNLLRASYVRQYLTCGKTNCRCRRGFKHGPFYYLVQCLGTGNVRKFLLKTSEQRKQARDGIAAHLKLQRQLAELSGINTELLRRSGNFNRKNGQHETLFFSLKNDPRPNRPKPHKTIVNT